MTDLGSAIEAALHDRKAKRRGDEVDFLCVAHDETNPSASWNRRKDVWGCLKCGASGTSKDLAQRLGIVVHETRSPKPPQVTAEYDYRDAAGKLLYQKVRYVPKRFSLRRPDGAGGWVNNMEGTRRVLYRLPELLGNDNVVWFVEGEKDADNLAQRGLTATTSPDGAQKGGKQKWQPHYGEWLKGRDVVLLPDNDEAGRDYAAYIAKALQGVARTVKVLSLEGLDAKGDVTDWLNDGGSVDELVEMAAKAPEWAPPSEARGLSAFPLTDAGNGELFAHLYGDRVRYDWQRGRWLVWGQHRWQPDPNGELYRLAKLAARERWRAAADEDSERREAIAKWAIASESESKLNAAIARARSEPPIADEGVGWDAHPMLLACTNGVVNLVTGELQKGRPADRITMGTNLPYEPAAACPRFLQFMEEILPDPEVREFMRLVIGYCLTGQTREQVWFMAYGTGANGKSTLFDVLRWIMGDLAAVMSFSTIERGKDQPIASDMAALAGKRLWLTSETQEHSALNVGRIKTLTGEEGITARELYQRQFTFDPIGKLMLGVNHKPVVNDDSHGFWRRLRTLPFLVTFGPDRQDKNLRETLKGEVVGILAWAVKAAGDWNRVGLPVPPAVALATVEYREESDEFGHFITDRCVERPDAWVQATDLYGSYKTWCESQGMRDREIRSSTTFGRRMGERYKRVLIEGRRRYAGIGLKAHGWASTLTAGEGCTDSQVRVEGLVPESSRLSRASREGFLENDPQPSPPSPEPCEDDDCDDRHYRWADGSDRHERER